MIETQAQNQLEQKLPDTLTDPIKYLEAAEAVTSNRVRALTLSKNEILQRLRKKAGLTIATAALLVTLGCGINIDTPDTKHIAPNVTQEQQYLPPASSTETPVSSVQPTCN